MPHEKIDFYSNKNSFNPEKAKNTLESAHARSDKTTLVYPEVIETSEEKRELDSKDILLPLREPMRRPPLSTKKEFRPYSKKRVEGSYQRRQDQDMKEAREKISLSQSA